MGTKDSRTVPVLMRASFVRIQREPAERLDGENRERRPQRDEDVEVAAEGPEKECVEVRGQRPEEVADLAVEGLAGGEACGDVQLPPRVLERDQPALEREDVEGGEDREGERLPGGSNGLSHRPS
jgi:hypothetical protein